MAYGFKAFNGSNEVLIDSSTKNLFFLSKAKYSRVLSTQSYCGGNIVLVYQASCPPKRVPLPFFSIPYTDRYVSLIKIVNTSGNTWEIYLLVSNTSTSVLPEVYIFIEYDNVLSPSGKYGMIVYQDNDNSEVTFDSRADPLVIKAAIDITPPTSPYTRTDYQMATGAGDHGSNLGYLESPGVMTYNNGTENFYNGKLEPDNTSTYDIASMSITKPIFNYSSIAQAYKKYYLQEDQSYEDAPGGLTFLPRSIWNKTKVLYWNNFATFSRAGIKYSTIGSTVRITVGWTVIVAGQENYGSPRSETWKQLAPNTDSWGTGGASGQFLASQSLNIRATVATVADGSRYD